MSTQLQVTPCLLVPCTAVSDSVVTNHVLEYTVEIIKPAVRDVILPERSSMEFNTCPDLLLLLDISFYHVQNLAGNSDVYSASACCFIPLCSYQ